MAFSILQRTARILCTALTILFCFSFPTAKPAILRPIHTAQYDRSSDVRPRAPNSYSELDLQTQGELIYGSSPKNGSRFLANMTLYAPNGLLMVLLERFDHLTSTIDCQGDDGKMSLTFSSDQAYEYALQTWGFVNANANGKFLLIANHRGCGPDEERQAYIITSVREDSASLTTYLAAELAPWSDIGGSYDVDYGHVVTHGHVPERRGLTDSAKGNFDETKSTDFEENLGHRDKVENIWHDDSRLMLDCINCFVAGSFHLTGHVKTHHWHIKEATLSASPKGFNATMELQAKVTYTEKLDKLSDKIEEHTKDLFSAPVPDLGIEIPHILKLGLTLSYQIGYSTKLAGSATFVLGATSSLPDDAIITIDLKDHDKSSSSGFDGAALVPIFDVTELSATTKFAVFTQIDMAFGIEIAKSAKLDAELNLKLPQLSTTYAAGYKEKGFCSQDDGALKTGVKITTELAIELWLEIKNKVEKRVTDLFSYKIFNVTKTLAEDCMALAIPGLTEETTPSATELLPIPTRLIRSSCKNKPLAARSDRFNPLLLTPLVFFNDC